MKAIKVAIAIGMALLLPLLAEMTVRIWAEPPKYESYYGYLPQNPPPKDPAARAKAESDAKDRQETFEKATAEFNLQMFYLAFPLGIVEIFVGFLLRRRTTLAAGLLFGGLSTVACGSYESWETLPGWARYISLLFVLAFLASLALALERDAENPAPA